MASSGSQCVACHMPAKNYMVIDPRRDHFIRIPRPELSKTLGSPNACTQCHSDQSDDWAEKALIKWYGPRNASNNYGTILFRARQGDPKVFNDLVALAHDPNRTFIVKATALELLHNYGADAITPMSQSLKDADPLIQLMAVSGLSLLPTNQRLTMLAPLLNDPIRAIRTQAARLLVDVPDNDFSDENRSAYRRALNDYKAAELALADMPEAQMNLGRLYWELKQYSLAEIAYKKAIKMDNTLVIPFKNLAIMYHESNQPKKAEEILHHGINTIKNPNDLGDLYYSLGLYFAEDEQWQDAQLAMANATKLIPHHPRLFYNYGLILQKQKHFSEAEKTFKTADALSPNDPSPLQALTMLYVEMKDWQNALTSAEAFKNRFPNHPLANELTSYIRQKAPPPQK